jgi:hypothetical protein
MTDIPEDRKPYPYYDPLSIRREAQEDGQLHVPTLAQLWLREFAKVGLSEVDASSGSPLKQSDSYYPRREPLYDDAMPLKLDDTRYTLRLKLDGRRSDRGYRMVEVLDTPRRTDMAILAALTAAEAERVDIGRLNQALSHIEPPLKESLDKQIMDEQRRLFSRRPKGTEISEELREARRQHEEDFDNIQVRTSDYVLALLRYYRPDFDDLPHKKKLALIKEGCERINTFLDALRQLRAFLEHEGPKPPIENAQRYVTAAELKDVEELSNPKIAQRMGITPTPYEVERGAGDVKKIRDWIRRGRIILANLLGEKGWQDQVKAKKEEISRWDSYSREEQESIQIAEHFNWPIEVARSWVGK